MKVLITGATGLVGTALVKRLVADGHAVCRLVRRETVSRKSDSGGQATGQGVFDVPWDPEASDGLSFADSQGNIAGAEAVVNLAGASIAGGRWTTQRKMVLRSSRAKTTRSLVAALGRLKTPPKVLVSASAVGYYGNRGDEVLTEESKAGDDFLAQLAREWEAEAVKAETAGMRVVRARFGIILAKQGGALPPMMRLFQFFVGGKIGSGRQWMSWITLEDVIGILVYALKDASVSGAINVVAFAAAIAGHRGDDAEAPALSLLHVIGQRNQERHHAREVRVK